MIPAPAPKTEGTVRQNPVQLVYEELDRDFNTVWKMGADGYPVLRWQ
jgi:hypothetical protein